MTRRVASIPFNFNYYHDCNIMVKAPDSPVSDEGRQLEGLNKGDEKLQTETKGGLKEGTNSTRPTTTSEHQEYQYIDLIRRVLEAGEPRADRTGTGTISLFAPPNLRFSLADSTLPLLTTKRVFLRGIVEELVWFIRGCTDSTALSKRGVKIWDGNGSKEFLEKRGLTGRREGDLGPVYGFQWRHFGAKYTDCETDYSGQGVDQLREVIRKIKEDPTDRRIILSAWNPAGESTTFVIEV